MLFLFISVIYVCPNGQRRPSFNDDTNVADFLRITKRRSIFASPQEFDGCFQVVGRVDRQAFRMRFRRFDAEAVFEPAELFERFQFFERALR